MPKKPRSFRYKEIYLNEEGLGESTHINFVFTPIYINEHIVHVYMERKFKKTMKLLENTNRSKWVMRLVAQVNSRVLLNQQVLNNKAIKIVPEAINSVN